MRAVGLSLYLLFVASWFLHLTARLPVLGDIRFDLILLVIVFLCALLSGQAPGPEVESDTGKYLKILFIYIFLTIPFVEWPGSVVRAGIPNFVKAVVFYFFTIRFVTTRSRLKLFMFFFLLCQSFRVVEPVYLHITQGYWGSMAHMADDAFMNRLAGSPYDIINPNGLAFVILLVFPFLHYLSDTSFLHRMMYWTLAPVLVYALVLTGSRSGLVCFGVILL